MNGGESNISLKSTSFCKQDTTAAGEPTAIAPPEGDTTVACDTTRRPHYTD